MVKLNSTRMYRKIEIRMGLKADEMLGFFLKITNFVEPAGLPLVNVSTGWVSLAVPGLITRLLSGGEGKPVPARRRKL